MAALRFPRAVRLLRPGDFAALRRGGQRLSSRLFLAEYRLTDNANVRLGMAVSRRVSKRAVVRNRIRRVVRESFRLNRHTLPVCDLLMIARPVAAAQDNATLRADIEHLWRKLLALNLADTTGTMRADR